MAFKLSRSSAATLATVDERLQKVCHRALEISRIDFGVPSSGGKRTAEQQKALYDDGKSNCDGYKSKSYHQTGLALDFYAYVDGKASWDKYHLSMVATAFLQAACELGVKLEWGGLWSSFQDMPHVQISEG